MTRRQSFGSVTETGVGDTMCGSDDHTFIVAALDYETTTISDPQNRARQLIAARSTALAEAAW